jgi:hypothetical protein
MAEQVTVGQVIYPTYDAGQTGLTPGVQITNKRNGATLLARTSTGVAEQPTTSGSYDYTAGFTVPSGVYAFKVGWNNGAGQIIYTEDYEVEDSQAAAVGFTIAHGPWPVGTAVSLSAAQSDPAGNSGQPLGPSLQTASAAADGSVTFTNLTAGFEYIAAAQVGGTWLRVKFRA